MNDITAWCASRTISAYGLRIGIRTNEPEILACLDEYFPPLWKLSNATTVNRLFSLRIDKQYELFEANQPVLKSRSRKFFLEELERRIKMYVAEMAPRRVFVHAGVVAWRGKGIIIPGRSYSGKTTLVAALVRAGAVYYSDEYAVLDAQGRVHPYPQPLAIRRPGQFNQKKYPVEKIGGLTGTTPLSVALVFISKYQPNGRWRPQRISAGQGILELLNHTVSARRKPAIVFPTLQHAISSASILKSTRGDTDITVQRVLQEVEK